MAETAQAASRATASGDGQVVRRLLPRAAEGELSGRSQVIAAVQAINHAIATYWQVAAAQT